MNGRRGNRIKLVAIGALFALPVVAAWILHQAGYEPRAERNYGTLLDPPQDLREVVATDAAGARVDWNTAERTWDCPCHGSRFNRYGNVLNGPATTGLKEIADNSVREPDAASA